MGCRAAKLPEGEVLLPGGFGLGHFFLGREVHVCYCFLSGLVVCCFIPGGVLVCMIVSPRSFGVLCDFPMGLVCVIASQGGSVCIIPSLRGLVCVIASKAFGVCDCFPSGFGVRCCFLGGSVCIILPPVGSVCVMANFISAMPSLEVPGERLCHGEEKL